MRRGLALLLLACVALPGAAATWTSGPNALCAGYTLAVVGADLQVRCPGRASPLLTIKGAKACPKLHAQRDAFGNLFVTCR